MEEKTISEYKILSIDYVNNLANDTDIIKSINDKFKGKIFLEQLDNKLFIYLKELDLTEFETYIKSILVRYNYPENNMFYQLLEKIKSIGSYGIKSGTRIYINYNKERKVKQRKEKIQKRHLYYYAENSNFSKKNNELPNEFLDKIITGDSEEILKTIPDNSIDLIFTSPPYNFGLDYNNNEDDVNWNDYFNKLFRIFNECIRVLKYAGRIVIDIQPLFSDYIPAHHIISNYFMQNKMIWRNEILWEKSNYNCKYTSWGSWNSPSSPYLKYTWEFLEVFSKGDIKKPSEHKESDLKGDDFKKWVYAKWNIAPERNMSKFGHPAMFPEELATRVIKLFSFKGDIILDPFNGVGTTTKVAKQYDRHYLGIDISKEYCDIAEKRLREITKLDKFL
jgi:DNA modification methylase